ncbi:hypothetical protein PV328_009465 [Microctonus aethiopoides]|uniref:Uncharacterized protein n=1 Tax=Microctonus aethiopoides TaxID=144406 RepID=A0AA39C5Y8_9HYME|nr:hypothetical protein PV328_009465 [Microctonus aethiopoides]
MFRRDLFIFFMTIAIVQVIADVSETFNNEPLVHVENITEANLNSLFDQNIELIRNIIYEKNLDPLEMPDRILGIADTLPFAKLHLRDGWVQQLASIKRTGDVIARYYERNLTIEFDLGWQDIDVNYAFRALLYLREGNFHGYFNNVRVSAMGNIDLETYNLQLKFFKIIDAGDFAFELSGNIADYLINAMSRVVTTFAKERVLREIEYHFVNSIQEKIDEINELLPEPMKTKAVKYLEQISK